MNFLFELCVKSILAQYHKLQLDISVYEYVNNKDVSKIMNKNWKDQTKTQRIYSGSATRSPSLPYSTPRVTYSRVFFTNTTSSLLAEKTLHNFFLHQLTTLSQMSSPNSSQNQSHTTTHLLYNLYTPLLLHNFSHLHYFFFTTQLFLYYFNSQLLTHLDLPITHLLHLYK